MYSPPTIIAGTPRIPEFLVMAIAFLTCKSVLKELKDFSTQEKYIFSHTYEVGDVLLFDNLTTMHRAKNEIDYVKKDESNARLLWRLSCKGKPRLIN